MHVLLIVQLSPHPVPRIKMAEMIPIGSKHWIGKDQPAFIIAEIGQNHQGDSNVAKKLMLVAKDCGADCVKFQKTCIAEKFNKSALSRPYRTNNSWGLTYGGHKNFLEFSDAQFRDLQAFAIRQEILFTASAMDVQSLDFLQSIDVPFVKIGSGDSNNLVLIKKAAATRIPLVISTGMQHLAGVRKIYTTVSEYHKNFALLQCTSSYPTPLEDVHLNVIPSYRREFPDIVVGYSGHELGIDVTVAAVALGAKVIERHITLDKGQKGSDHGCSLEPQELRTMIKNIRNVEVALGSSTKEFQKSERSCFEKLSKSIVAARNLKRGDKIGLDDLKIKVAEPRGLDASVIDDLVGKHMKTEVDEDESIFEHHIY